MEKGQTNLRSLNITAGNFFFRYRNALFPLIFVFAALTLRPTIMFGTPLADHLVGASGMVIALLGEAVRFVTIGFEYIHRGGKHGRVYARHLVQGGVFGLVRNPMYVGNALIVIGMTMYLGSPLGYLVLIPFFLFVYQALIAAEEAYLRNTFNGDYDDYCEKVNRFVPRLNRIPQAFSGLRFNWRRSLRKDLGTVVGLTMGLIFIPVLRSYFLYGWAGTGPTASVALKLSLAVITVYLFLLRLKERNHL
ncbi:MAG: isoprenylcysteine carboxylmethyltransferase family protein [Candidatus Binatia bacterium]